MAEMRRVCRILFLDRRLPGKVYQLYFSLLNRVGIRLTTIRLKNGLTVKGYTHCFFMFYEIWSKRDYDIPGFDFTQNTTVIDIGANQGFFSLYAASKGATVYAFEPCVDNFEILKWNVSTNRLEDKVKMFNAAVTHKEGKVDLFVGLDASGDILSGSVSVRNANRGGIGVQTQSVESVTLNSLLRDLHIEQCDFLKMDCEGAEYDILASTSPTSFEQIARISIECHENRMQEAVSLLKNAGFEIICERQGEADILKAAKPRNTCGA
jgi:FkbM family methyltransferase